ncbi:MAG: methyltransferase domain-containing protein [Prolixibacteraceae bacterium]|jgi:tocopherol O-methyltransferase|nr:methyltransferase domain-containing protein [Prolixibacteraceae bacterium]MBT6767274.1 methyltransferase domain-containing protein [Prolixibacteraceae bacterium]MBT6999156.1 methyltransferase domain-containing protein [Prolixibacteraceae bacterium]MBT7395969.1 methyltransferase domain-containing protein [Prolixibacteraceae bacterium]
MDFEYKKSIVSYYDNTRLDYRLLWFRKNTRSVHFGFYDEGVKSHGDALLNLNKVLANKVEVKKDDVILDAGCGQGAGAIWLSENYDVEVKGITLVPHQVKIAKKHAQKLKLNNRVTFSEQDYCNTSFDDESFSVIWACESMCHAEIKSDFYKEAYRLLKPGGRIICADYFRTERDFQQKDEKLIHDWLAGWSIKDLDTFSEHKKNAVNNGFVDFEIENITEYTEPSLKHLHSMANKLWKFGKILKKIGFRNDVNHGNHFGSIKQYEALQNKLWYYGLLSMKKN